VEMISALPEFENELWISYTEESEDAIRIISARVATKQKTEIIVRLRGNQNIIFDYLFISSYMPV